MHLSNLARCKHATCSTHTTRHNKTQQDTRHTHTNQQQRHENNVALASCFWACLFVLKAPFSFFEGMGWDVWKKKRWRHPRESKWDHSFVLSTLKDDSVKSKRGGQLKAICVPALPSCLALSTLSLHSSPFLDILTSAYPLTLLSSFLTAPS